MSYAGLLQMQWGARACKTTEERTVMYYANTNTTRGNSLPELCTGSWSCPALDLHLELGSNRWSNQSEQSSSYIQHSYSHSTCMTSCAALNCSVTSHCVQMLYDQPLCVALKCSVTSHCQLWTLQPHHIRTIQPWMCDLINYKSESSPSALRELPTLACLPTNMARFQCINSCALCGKSMCRLGSLNSEPH